MTRNVKLSSCHASSEELCKSSGATTPLGSMNSSFEPSSLDATKADKDRTDPSKIVTQEISLETAKSSCQPIETQPKEVPPTTEKDAIVLEG
jgi:hypothetical protein